MALPSRESQADRGDVGSQKHAPHPPARLNLPLGSSCLKESVSSASTFPGTTRAGGRHVTVSTHDQLVTRDPLDRLVTRVRK